MKKYIILGWCGGMGGGNIYTRNQCIIARKLGWVPIVFHFSKKTAFISDLKPFDRNSVLEMMFPPCYYSKNEVKKVLNKFIRIIDPRDNDEFFVESNGVRYSYWGELIAKELRCKHFAFLVEYYFTWNDDYYDFFSFKYKRKELVGIGPSSLSTLFGNRKEVLSSVENRQSMTAFCTNSVEEIDFHSEYDFSSYDLVIGNIGRSTKPYVQYLSEDLVEFGKKHEDKRILFVIVGGEKGTPEDTQIRETLKGCKNIDIYSTGFLFPISLQLLKHIDVAIATSGCIKVAQDAELVTIAYKDNDRMPYGVCGYDLKEYPLPQKPVVNYKLSELLDEIIFGGFCDNYSYEPMIKPISVHEGFSQLEKDTFYMLEPNDLAYYDTTKVFPRSLLRKLYIKTFGKIIPLHRVIDFFYSRKGLENMTVG